MAQIFDRIFDYIVIGLPNESGSVDEFVIDGDDDYISVPAVADVDEVAQGVRVSVHPDELRFLNDLNYFLRTWR